MAYVPVGFLLAGMTAYTVLAGADFGAGLWTLLAPGRSGTAIRDHCRHAMGPVWEANHVWLIFVLVVCWTGYPTAFGSITSTLAAPLLIAAIGIIFRGAAYALRGASGPSRLAEAMLGVGSLITPFALGTAVGAIALGHVPVGNALGDPVTSWLNAGSVLVGLLGVVFSGYLAAVYLAADAMRFSTERTMASAFRTRALCAGLVSGALALAGLLVLKSPDLPLVHGWALALVILSGAAGLGTLLLCWAWRFGLARLTAALAVAAVVVGWTVAQTPRLLPGLTVTQAAAGRSTLIALLIAVCGGLVVLVPSLALLFTLFLRGRLDTPEHPVSAPSFPGGSPAPPPGSAPGHAPETPPATGAAPPPQAPETPPTPEAAPAPPAPRARSHVRARSATAVVGLLGGAALLVFGEPPWTLALGTLLLITCAVSAFSLAAE